SDNPPSPTCQYWSCPSTRNVIGPTTGGNDIEPTTAPANVIRQTSSLRSSGLTEINDSQRDRSNRSASASILRTPGTLFKSRKGSSCNVSRGMVLKTNRRPLL